MTTVSELIQMAGRKLGESSMTAEELDDGMRALNMMLREWAASPTGVYKVTQESFSISAATKTIGGSTSGADVTTGWPIRIIEAFIRVSDVDYPVTEISDHDWARVAQKSLSQRPYRVHHDRSYPAATLTFWPSPGQTYTVYLWSHKALAEYSSVGTVIALPPEYGAAMMWNLAIELAPEYERNPSSIVIAKAMSTKAALTAINADIPTLDTRVVGRSSGRNFDITGSLYK